MLLINLSLILLLFPHFLPIIASSQPLGFTYNGFPPFESGLTLDGEAECTQDRLLALATTKRCMGHAFFSEQINFKNATSNDSVFSFSTTFVFGIVSESSTVSSHGIAFVVTPSPVFPKKLPSKYLGLFNRANNGNPSNHVVAVELDTIYNRKFKDINDNHVGIDINGIESVQSEPAGYYSDKNGQFFQNLSIFSGKATQVWVEYDGLEKIMNVTIAPIEVAKPIRPLLSLHIDLSPIFLETMYVGFSSSTGYVQSSHYILGWSFQINGMAEELKLSELPKLPVNKRSNHMLTIIGLVSPLIVLVIAFIVFYVIRMKKFAEVLEDWETEYGPHRFKYKDLYIATKGFSDKKLLGKGGFGRVYRGVLPNSKMEIAVKRVSHESRQGMREFVAEIVTIGRLKHRNLVQLLGYCRRKMELLLVYEYMANGSLDKFLYDQPKFTLNWQQRFKVIKGVASGLLYLHEEWEQVVIHRDVKASNVLLDHEWNGRLGDFGLARLYNHGTDPQTTHAAGTLGYLAPEQTRTGKATTSTDVYAFGAFLLEVACGRRPIEPEMLTEDVVLVDWVFPFWRRGEILVAIDKKLGNDYVPEEVELVLKLGLICSHSEPLARPSMRQVMQYLEGDFPIPEFESFGISSIAQNFPHHHGFDGLPMPMGKTFMHSSIANSILSGGR